MQYEKKVRGILYGMLPLEKKKKLFIPVIIYVGPSFSHWVSSTHTSRLWKFFYIILNISLSHSSIFWYITCYYFPFHFVKESFFLKQERIPGIIRFNMLISQMSISVAKSWRDLQYFMDLVSKRGILLQFNGIFNSLQMVVDWIHTQNN